MPVAPTRYSSTSLSGSYSSSLSTASSLDKPYHRSTGGALVSTTHRTRYGDSNTEYRSRSERSETRTRELLTTRRDTAPPVNRASSSLAMTAAELYQKYSPSNYVPLTQRLLQQNNYSEIAQSKSNVIGQPRNSASTINERPERKYKEITPPPSYSKINSMTNGVRDSNGNEKPSVSEIRRKFDPKMTVTKLPTKDLCYTKASVEQYLNQLKECENGSPGYTKMSKDDKPVSIHIPDVDKNGTKWDSNSITSLSKTISEPVLSKPIERNGSISTSLITKPSDRLASIKRQLDPNYPLGNFTSHIQISQPVESGATKKENNEEVNNIDPKKVIKNIDEDKTIIDNDVESPSGTGFENQIFENKDFLKKRSEKNEEVENNHEETESKETSTESTISEPTEEETTEKSSARRKLERELEDSKRGKVYVNTCHPEVLILTEENPATVDIMSIEPTSSQKLLDTANVLTQNTDDDLIVPLNSINDSLFKQDSSMFLAAPEDEVDGADEDISNNEIISELNHEDEEDNKSLELLEMLPEMLDIITQSKFTNFVTELSALDLSHKKPLNIVVGLFVDNFADIIEEFMKKKVNKFVQEVETLKITTTEHFNILIDLLCEKIADEPDLAHHFAYVCDKLSVAKEFRSLLIRKCQNDFETFVLDNNQKIDEEDPQMNRRCVGIVRFIGELYNKDMVTTKIVEHCLTKLLEQSKEINLECACELLNTSGIKIGREYFIEKKVLSKALKKIDELLNSEPNSDNISCRVKRMMQNTLDFSKQNWKPFPLPKTLDEFEKKGDRKRLLMSMLNNSETEDLLPRSSRLGSAGWFDNDRVESKQETINANPLHTKYSVETLKLAVTNKNLSYLKEPPTYFDTIYENYSVLEKFQADPATYNDRIISYQEVILSHVDNKDSTTLTQDKLSQNQYKIARHLIQEFIKNSDSEKLALYIESQIPRRNHGALMDFILDEALTSQHTTILSNAMFLLVETSIVSLEIFKAAIKEIFYTLRILYEHIPFPALYKKLACILAPHIENHNITLADIYVMSNNIIIVKEGHHFLGTLMVTLRERKGEAFVKTLWVDSKLSPVQWMFTEMVTTWVADYELSFLHPHLFVNHRPHEQGTYR